MCVTPLRHALARNIGERKHIALQHGDLLEKIRQRPRGQQAAHAGADHNRMFANLSHDDAPACVAASLCRVPMVRGSDRTGFSKLRVRRSQIRQPWR